MKNLIIYLVLVLFTNNIEQDPCYGAEPLSIKPYYIIVEAENGARIKVPNNIVKIDIKEYHKWWCEKEWNIMEEYVDGSAQTIKHKF